MPDDAVPGDSYDLRPDGSIVLWVNGQRIVMRVPRIGDIRFGADSYQAVISERQERLDAELEAIRSAPEPDLEAIQDAFKKGLQTHEETTAAWWRAIVARMADGAELPPFEDLPGFFGMQDVAVDVINHWRATPPPSGVPRT